MTFQDQPSRRLWELEDEKQNDDCEEDLESNRESPSNGVGIQEGEAKVKPVAEANATSNQCTLSIHQD